MGCFSALRGKKKKKKADGAMRKHANSEEITPTKLPEPEARGPTLQSAPPSFRNRGKVAQPVNGETNFRTRALSAPSSLHVADGEHLIAMESDEQQECRFRGGVGKDQRLNPVPLPLPSPQTGGALKNLGSFKLSNSSGPIFSGPLPLPPSASGGLRNFSYDEVAGACQHFSIDQCVSEGLSSMAYRASFGDDSSSKKFDATITRLSCSGQGLKDFLNEVNTISSLQHPNLCKLLGFHAREGSDLRILVYEKLFHGSLDQILIGRSDGPLIDWSNRMKVALCTARGLAFLHEEGPFQAMYREFSIANIQIDKDFTAKLSGYGCTWHNPDIEMSNAYSAVATLSPETLERGILTPKSNIWSFGIVLLELLTGRKNLDSRLPKEERNLVKWSKPYLTDDCRLSLFLDYRLKGRVPPKAARSVADIALKCLQREPSERPTMRAVMESLENVQDMKHPCRFPIQEPTRVSGKQMFKSPSFNDVVISRAPRPNLSSSPPSRNRLSASVSPPRPFSSRPLPPRSCASTLSPDVSYLSGPVRKPISPAMRGASVEGF